MWGNVMRESSLTGLESCNAPDSDGKQCFCLECSTWTLASFCLMSAGLPALHLLRRPQAHHTQCSRYEWEPREIILCPVCAAMTSLLQGHSESAGETVKRVKRSQLVSWNLSVDMFDSSCVLGFQENFWNFGKDFVNALKWFNQDVFQSSCSDKMAHDKTGIVAQLIAHC